jgi:hypothetical protein
MLEPRMRQKWKTSERERTLREMLRNSSSHLLGIIIHLGLLQGKLRLQMN